MNYKGEDIMREKEETIDFGLQEVSYDKMTIQKLQKNKAIQFLSAGINELRFKLNLPSDEIRSVLMYCVDFFILEMENDMGGSPRRKGKSLSMGILELDNKGNKGK